MADAAPRYEFGEFVELRDAQDLFRKLKHDYERLLAHPLDSYAAFDFFVTANHLVDWMWPLEPPRPERRHRRTDTIPRICEQLTDGAKHFRLGAASTRSQVTRASGKPGGLVVDLEAKEALRLGVGDPIAVPALADMVVSYWRRRLGP